MAAEIIKIWNFVHLSVRFVYSIKKINN